MPMNTPMRKRIITAAGCVFVGLFGIVFCNRGSESLYKPFNTVRVGMPERDVITLLGSPDKVVLKNDPATHANLYYFNRKDWPERAVSNKILIYAREGSYAYIYIDPTGKVEYIYFSAA